MLVLLLYEGKSIIRSVGIFFNVDNTAGWAWGNAHGLSLSPLLTLWCRFDLDSALLSSDSFCKHGSPTFHLHERKAVTLFLWAKGLSGCEMHRRMSVQYRNSVVSKQSVYRWSFKNGWISIKHKEGAGPRTKWNSACVAYLLVQNLFFFLRL